MKKNNSCFEITMELSDQGPISRKTRLKSYNSMKTLAKYHVCNHCVIGKKTFKNMLIGPGKLPGLSRNGSQNMLVTFLRAYSISGI